MSAWVLPCNVRTLHTATPHWPRRICRPTMVNLRRGYREEPKVGPNGFKALQGRFLPNQTNYDTEMKQLDEIEDRRGRSSSDKWSDAEDGSETDAFGGDELGMLAEREVGVGSGVAEDSGAAASKKWSRRAEAAKKRWANAEYRGKMLASRRARKEENEDKTMKRLEIGSMDSIAHSSEARAAEINAYARSIALRQEKLRKYHRDAISWMEERLASGVEVRMKRSSTEWKQERQRRRSEIARRRHEQRAQTDSE